jgi:catechol 2,3-dioxygenase-like lactoylglutathione lyase family enzyme
LNSRLDTVDHVAVSVHDVKTALDWYCRHFQCQVLYQDDTWALVQFANIKLALVVTSQHPPHLGFFTPKASDFGPLTAHRDGTRSVYITDPSGNSVEFLTTE